MSKLFYILCFLIGFNTYAQESNPEKKLTEKIGHRVYRVDIVERNHDGGLTNWSDIIRFNNGKISSKFSDRNGFYKAEYMAKEESFTTITPFKASAKNNNTKSEILTWIGTINGDTIQGTAVKFKNKKVKTTYFFTGYLE